MHTAQHPIARRMSAALRRRMSAALRRRTSAARRRWMSAALPRWMSTALPRRLAAIAPAAAIASLAVLAAGCGSSSGTSSTDPSPQSFVGAAYKYASCMRNHGVTNFPEPQVSSHNGGRSVVIAVSGLGLRSPQFKAAQQVCRGILPAPPNINPTQVAQQQHARELELLAFARCLRSHGLTGFPDPTSQGQLTIQMVDAAGIDLHAPIVLTAAKACVGVTHGAVTPADVERAVNGGQ
jgi:hypothetical protein